MRLRWIGGVALLGLGLAACESADDQDVVSENACRHFYRRKAADKYRRESHSVESSGPSHSIQ
jgi:hypothetical protein